MNSGCRCASKGFEFCDCPEKPLSGESWLSPKLRAEKHILELEREIERLKRAEKLLHDALRGAEWQDKNIYPCQGAAYQTWKLTIYLPVILSAKDKSPETALQRALLT